MYPIPELAKLMSASLPAWSSSEMPWRSTCTLSNTLARSLLYCYRHAAVTSLLAQGVISRRSEGLTTVLLRNELMLNMVSS